MQANGRSRELTVVTNRALVVDEIYALKIKAALQGSSLSLKITSDAGRELPVRILVSGASGIPERAVLPVEGELRLEGTLDSANRPYVGVLIPEDNHGDRYEFLDERLTHMGE